MKIMEFFGEPLSYGGQEAFIMNMYENFKIPAEYVFVTPFYANNTRLLELIHERNDQCIAFEGEFESALRKKYILEAARKSISEMYDVVHIHSGSIFTLLLAAYIAKSRKVRKIIVHSHCTGYDNLVHKVIKVVSDVFLERVANVYLACSTEAGMFKFSKRVINGNHFHVIKNGIDIEKYKYNDKDRKRIRDDLKLGDSFVICNVGRYSPQKNQTFAVEVFKEFLKLNENSFLVIAGGSGPAEGDITDLIEKYGISHKVKKLKERSDINAILSAADVFIFPSVFEGLGISAIEAQAAGLHTVCSECVPEETAVSKLFHKLYLKDGAGKWAEFINGLNTDIRVDVTEDIIRNGYSAKQCAEELEDIYHNGV